MIFRASVFFVFAAIAFSQGKFEFGVRADAPIVGPLTTISYPMLCANGAQCGYYESTPYHPAIGLSASIPIARRLRLRFDPEYQRIGVGAASYTFEYLTTVNSPLAEVVGETPTTANRWQLPLLLEARVSRHVRFGVGPAVSILTDVQTIGKVVDPFYGTRYYVEPYFRPLSREAIAGGEAALEFPFRFGHVTIAPELRYKRWFDKHFGGNWTLDEFTGGIAIRFSH